jgi:hypothetical protein
MASLYTNIPQEAKRALNRAILLHLFDPNVSLIDLGLRIYDTQGYKIADEFCVRVHLRCKLFGERFEAFAARYPERVIIPERIGFPVDIPQADYQIQWWPWWSWKPTPSGHRSRLFNPVQGGISISNALENGYATLGGGVFDRKTGREMILSNWHVLAGWYAQRGLAIYQPGRWHGGHSNHTVAHLERHALDQKIDAAVAELANTRQLINDQLGLGPVTGVGNPAVGMRVTKSGCGSGVTKGIITGIGGSKAHYYDGIPRVISHKVHIAQVPEGGQVSRKGDSGAWWLEAGTNKAVALHFAGSDFPEYGLAIAMPQVLDALSVHFIP